MMRALLYILTGTFVLLYIAVLVMEQYLEDTLPGRLSQAMSLAVVIDDIDLNPLQLEVEIDRLVIGGPDSPAIVVEKLALGAAFDFKKFRIGLASASYVYLNQKRWDKRKRRNRVNLLFLDPYIPAVASIGEFHYEFAGRATRFEQVEGKRDGDQLILAGRAGGLNIGLSVKSVEQALGYRELQLTADLSNEFVSPVRLEMRVSPDEPGYLVKGNMQAVQSSAVFEAWSVHPWELPVESNIAVSRLSPEAVIDWFGLLNGNDDATQITDLLKEPLPSLVFPTHSSRLVVDELTIGKSSLGDSQLEIVFSPAGIVVPGYWFELLDADVKGQAEILQGQDGWQLRALAKIKLSQDDDEDPSLWEIQSGDLTLDSHGSNAGELIDHATGEVRVLGVHERYPDRQAILKSTIGSDSERFLLENLEFSFGDALVTGTVSLPGEFEQRLSLDMKASNLDMDLFLSSDGAGQSELSMDLGKYPEIALDWVINGENITIKGVQLSQVGLTVDRISEEGEISLQVKGLKEAKGQASLAWQSSTGAQTMFRGNVQFSDVFPGTPFTAKDVRASGHIDLAGRGASFTTLAENITLDGAIAFETRDDSDWERAGVPGEFVNVGGSGRLIVEENILKGIDIGELVLTGAAVQAQGNVYFRPGGDNWLRVKVAADRLDLDRLQRLLPPVDDEGSSKGFLSDAGGFDVHLKAAQLVLRENQFKDVLLDWRKNESGLLQELAFTHRNGGVQSQSRLELIDDQLSLSVDAEVTDLFVEEYLAPIEFNHNVPLSGKVSIRGVGRSMTGLVSGLSGTVSLNGTETSEVQKKRQIDLSLLRTEDGINVSIDSLIVGQNNIAGDAVISGEDRIRVDLQLGGGHIVLSDLAEVETLSSRRESALDRTARVGTEMAGRLVDAPSRLMHGEDSSDKKVELPESERVFSDTPLDLAGLSAVDIRVKGKLDSMITPWAEVNSLEFDASLEAGRVDALLMSSDINGGQGRAKIYFDASSEVPVAGLEVTLAGIGNYPESDAAKKSTFIDFKSSGSSFSELAAGLNGSLYVEFGPGKLDYRGISFLTQDITTSMVKSLIPGAERDVPEMLCAVTWGEVRDGVGTTPFGYALQTRKANLLGKMGVNLREEQLVIEFDSKSRNLTGLSVGDMFSKAVSVEGSLRNPKVVTKKGSLAWRGWAAISTGGLSVIGEGVIGQVLSGEDPCGEVKRRVREVYCGNDPVQSTLVCPG